MPSRKPTPKPQLVELTPRCLDQLAERLRPAPANSLIQAGAAAAHHITIPGHGKFCKLAADGSALPDNAADFAAVYIRPLGLTVARITPPKLKHKAAEQWAKDLTHTGHKDWRLISRLEGLNGIWDEERHNPAYDPLYWSWLPTDDWYWTRTAYAGAADGAWSLGFNYGDSSASLRCSSGYALAVRGGSPRQ
jgi:hypothetical protein